MPPGRRKSFDTGRALDAAMMTFWRQGYRLTSVDDLTEAMGINRPSLYNAFGGKAQVFIRCLDHYAESIVHQHELQLQHAGDWIDAMDEYLSLWTSVFSDPSMPGGCLIASHVGDDLENEPEIKARMAWHADHTERAITCRLKQAVRDGQIGSGVSISTLARTILCFLAGMSCMARAGFSRRKLDGARLQVIEMLRELKT